MKDFSSDGVITIRDYKELFLAIPNGPVHSEKYEDITDYDYA